MDFVTLFITAFLVGLSGAIMPGPMFTVTIAETPSRGYWVGPKIVLGHGIIEGLLVVGLASGLTSYLEQPTVTGGIGVIGGGVLLWFARGIYLSVKNREVQLTFADESTAATKELTNFNPVTAGIVLSITNPYWSLWWATVGVSYVVLAMNLGAIGLVTFFTGHILSDLAWFSLVSFVVYSGRNLISPKIYRWVLGCCAVFLAALGCWFLYDGFSKILMLWR